MINENKNIVKIFIVLLNIFVCTGTLNMYQYYVKFEISLQTEQISFQQALIT